MKVEHVKPGDTFKIKNYISHNDSSWETEFQTWVVTDIYPYHVVAIKRGSFERESFNIGQLVQMGLEGRNQPKRKEGNRTYLNGNRIVRNVVIN